MKHIEKNLPHKMMHFVRDENGLPIGFIGVHRGSKKHPAFGATRIHSYKSLGDAHDDVLKLSELMSYKTALADLPYGGGKGVLLMSEEDQNNPERKKKILSKYAHEINKLGGSFVTGADVGVSPDDVKFLKLHSPHIVGVERDPVKYTTIGIMHALRAALEEKYGEAVIHKHTYGVLGVGKVGSAVIESLTKEGGTIYAADIHDKQVEEIQRKHPEVIKVSPDALIETEMDVFIPCALGGILNTDTIAKFKAKIVVGSANNQLENTEAGDLLHERGILYAPDYVANGGGLISVINEYEKGSEAELENKVGNITGTIKEIFTRSKSENIATHRIADQIGKERIDKIFPAHNHKYQ